MTDHEQIYAKLVRANPVPDPEALPETLNTARPQLRIAEPHTGVNQAEIVDPPFAPENDRRRRSIQRVAMAAGLLLLVGVGVTLARGSNDTPIDAAAQPDPVTPIEQATAFIARLDDGDVDGAAELLSDPLGEVWFATIGAVQTTEQVGDYLDFYVTLGMHTELGPCDSDEVGPSVVVTCEADHFPGALSLLDLEFPTFDMTFEVWNDGIRSVGWSQRADDGFSSAFARSQFFGFRFEVLEPRGLVQESGDPIWSEESGALMMPLIKEFIARD